MFNYHSLIPWGSFRGRQEEKWGSFRGRFGDHFEVGDHFGVGIISGAVQSSHDKEQGHLIEFIREKYVISILLIALTVIPQIMAKRKQNITYDLQIYCFINIITLYWPTNRDFLVCMAKI